MSRILKIVATVTWWLVALTATSQLLSAQATRELAGTVRDATGALAPGATLTVTGKTLPSAVPIKTNDQGKFTITLPTGLYQVKVVADGHDEWTGEVEVKPTGATLDVWLRFSDSVTVTATKIGTAEIQKTPVAITALDRGTLDQANVERVEHLTGLVPTLSVSQTPGDAPLLTLRGIGNNTAIPGGDPSVTMQIDGVYISGGTAIGLDFLDVERVEVLRGPQGTLFGRNSIGGTINIVTRQPTNVFETSGRLTIGNYDKLRVEGAMSGPLVPNRITGSFAFLRGSRDGFVKDVDHPDHPLGTEDTWAGRGQLRFHFGSGHDVLVSGDYSNARGVPLPLARPLAAGPAAPAFGGFSIPDDFWSVRPNDLAERRNTQSGALARLTVRLGDTVTLTSLTAYRHDDGRLLVDADTTERPVATTETSGTGRHFTQEVTLVQRTAKLSWIGGAYWFDERLNGAIEISPFQGRSTIDTSASALFGQARYLLSNRLAVTGGLRYSHEEEEGHGIARGVPVHGAYDVTAEVADAAWTPKASVELEASRDAFCFFSATRGFKAGGVNVFSPESDTTFRPELAWNYEAGWKQTLAGGRGRVNAALFYVDYRDLQVQTFIFPGVVEVTNAGRAINKGIELEGAWSPGRGFQFLGIMSWLEATYHQYESTGGNATGKRLREAPVRSGSGSALYEFRPGGIGTVSVRGDVSLQTDVFFTPFNIVQQSQPGYSVVHARAGFVPRSRRWELSVYMRNLGRQEYVTSTWLSTRGVAYSGRPGEPRHWGTQFTIRR